MKYNEVVRRIARITAFLWIVANLVPYPVLAQDGMHGHGHAENHDWYQHLKQPGTGYSCCNGTVEGIEGDCRPTKVWSDGEGGYRAVIDGHEMSIPARVILRKEDGSPLIAPDEAGHVCAGRSGMVYCAILSPPKS